MLLMKLNSSVELEWVKKFEDYSNHLGRYGFQDEGGAIFLTKSSMTSSAR